MMAWRTHYRRCQPVACRMRRGCSTSARTTSGRPVSAAGPHIPLGQLGARTAEIPQDTDIYVICRSGGRSARAAQALNGAGWRAVNVAGGMQDWAAAGRPMATDSGAEPFVA